jgi:protein arginine N-methyltransferase 1
MTMEYYRGMLIQESRIEAFRRGIEAAVRPGDRVLEIGAGLGTYAFFAARAGASKVWAVEGGPVIAVARTLARLNGVSDTVEFLRGWFPGVSIPGPVDVLIFEDYDSRLIDGWTWRVLSALHRDVLRPGTRVVPGRARLHLAPVFVPDVWRMVGPLGSDDDRKYGMDWAPSLEYIANTPLQVPITAGDLRHDPAAVAEVRLDRLPRTADLAGQASWRFDQPAVLHGLAYWFDLEVGETWLSNAPGGDPRSWGNLFLPLDRALPVAAGATVEAAVAPETAEDGAPSWLTWEVKADGYRFRGHEFKANPASLADLAPTMPHWVPELTREAEIEREILRLADGRRTVEEIARAVGPALGPLDQAQARTLVFNTLSGRTRPA